jgi:predicted methyltransferase
MGCSAWGYVGTTLFLAASLCVSAVAQSPEPTGATPPLTFGVPSLNQTAQAALQRAISGSERIEPARDRWRNPAATLQFFGVRPTDTVIEIWPGQGWYTSILGAYLKEGNGRLIVGHFDAASTNASVVRQIVDAYRVRFASDPIHFGSVNVIPFGPRSGPLGLPGTADSVLTFRNVHNWMAQGWAEKAFADFYAVLKPGGILGIEEHRGRTDEPQDPLARDGYVREDFVIQLAREAGFEFIGRSEVNANEADTKDHPFGVWTLPPVSRTSPQGQRDDPNFDRARFDAIGESDRMTLRFRKPPSLAPVPVIVSPSVVAAAANVGGVPVKAPQSGVPAAGPPSDPSPPVSNSRRRRRGAVMPTPVPKNEAAPPQVTREPVPIIAPAPPPPPRSPTSASSGDKALRGETTASDSGLKPPPALRPSSKSKAKRPTAPISLSDSPREDALPKAAKATTPSSQETKGSPTSPSASKSSKAASTSRNAGVQPKTRQTTSDAPTKSKLPASRSNAAALSTKASMSVKSKGLSSTETKAKVKPAKNAAATKSPTPAKATKSPSKTKSPAKKASAPAATESKKPNWVVKDRPNPK